MSDPAGNRIRAEWLDRVAIGLSGLCLIHCVATILLLSLFLGHFVYRFVQGVLVLSLL